MIDKFNRLPGSYLVEDAFLSTYLTKRQTQHQPSSINMHPLKNESIYDLSNKINESGSKLRNKELVQLCEDIHCIFSDCSKVLGYTFTKYSMLNTLPKKSPNSSRKKIFGPIVKDNPLKTKSNKCFKCSVLGCFKAYGSRGALFLHEQRIHSLHKPHKSNKDIKLLPEESNLLSNPNLRPRWGVDLKKVITNKYFKEKSTKSTHYETKNTEECTTNIVKEDDVFSFVGNLPSHHNYNNYNEGGREMESDKMFYSDEKFKVKKRLKKDSLSIDGDCNNSVMSQKSS